MDNLAARQQMVDQQVRTWEVLDPRVLGALAAVPREAFVPPAWASLAFADAPLPIGCGQTMLAPKLHGRILQALDIDAAATALEIGTGTGYLCACMGLLAREVRSIELHAGLAQVARANVARFAGKAEILTRDAFDPAPLGSYDVIAVTGSVPKADPRFEQSLRVGGRLFIIVGEAPVMEAMLVRRVTETEWLRETLFETVVEPLVGAATPDRFVF